MKTIDLLVTSLDITEDEYIYKGSFILKSEEKSLKIDLAEAENNETLNKIKAFFDLEESTETIKEFLMNEVITKSQISSRNSEGKDYEENLGKVANSLDIA